MKKINFESKDDSSLVAIAAEEIYEMLPDADMRYTLITLKNGDKHFVRGTHNELKKLLLVDQKSEGDII